MVDTLKDIRCFIGIPAPEALATQLNKQCKLWREENLYPDFKWVKKQDYHVTLHFIGEIPPSKVHKLIEALTSAKLVNKFNAALEASAQSPSQITLTGFPSTDAAKFIVAELPENPALTQLREALADILKAQEIDVSDKAFRPHISVARLKPKHTAPAVGVLGTMDATFEFTRYALFKSMLTPEGSHYEVLASIA